MARERERKEQERISKLDPTPEPERTIRGKLRSRWGMEYALRGFDYATEEALAPQFQEHRRLQAEQRAEKLEVRAQVLRNRGINIDDMIADGLDWTMVYASESETDE